EIGSVAIAECFLSAMRRVPFKEPPLNRGNRESISRATVARSVRDDSKLITRLGERSFSGPLRFLRFHLFSKSKKNGAGTRPRRRVWFLQHLPNHISNRSRGRIRRDAGGAESRRAPCACAQTTSPGSPW